MVIPYFIPAWSYGGPVKVCYEYAKNLIKRGHLVTVATTDTLDNASRIKNLTETIDDIKVYRFRNLSNRLAKNYNAYLPILFPFWLFVNINKYDVIYCHDLFTFQNFVVGIIAKVFNKQFLIQPHGAFSPIRKKSRFFYLKKVYMSLFENFLKKSKNIIVLTKNEKEDFTNIYPEVSSKIVIIPNGITPQDSNLQPSIIRQKYHIPSENKVIGYIGRIQYIKGIDISLEILRDLKNKLPFTYLIIGPDEGEKSKILTLIQEYSLYDNVIFTGQLEGQEKIDTIAACDMFLFTSRNEGLPMTVLEVASLGIPQIVSHDCHVPEIESSKSGYVIDIKNKIEFQQKILKILNNPLLHNTMSKNSKKMIQDYFHINKITDIIEQTLKS